MKTIVLTGLLAALVVPAQAQLFSRESLGGAAVGGLIGGIVGHNSGRHTAEGVGIGAGAGLLLGALVHQERQEERYAAPAYTYGPGYPYVYPAAYYYEPRPNYAVTGALLGGVAGGIIGNNSGHHTLEGIGIGAGAGLLLGGIAEHEARLHESRYVPPPGPVYYASSARPVAAAVAHVQAPAPAANPPVTIVNHYDSSSTAMTAANSLFGR